MTRTESIQWLKRKLREDFDAANGYADTVEAIERVRGFADLFAQRGMKQESAELLALADEMTNDFSIESQTYR
jgi:hypothetical protein